MITVVDYGVGNIGALLNMLEYVGVDAEASRDAQTIADASRLILPGVGAFDKAMSTLRSRELINALDHAVLRRRVPVLGVCLGMQLLARRSEEGIEAGLGWIAADVKRIAVDPASRLKVPHIGWSDAVPARVGTLFGDSLQGERFYFDHGYHVVCDAGSVIAATVDYGAALCCAVQSGHIHGVQFHPEKSHRHGMRLLERFAAWQPPDHAASASASAPA